jgi:glycine cleavage system H protein
MEFAKDCRYTKEHEWVRVEGKEVRIGITDYAQSALGDIVFVELPKAGQKLGQMQPFGSVEAVKAVSDLFSPISGEVLESNAALGDDPTLANRSPFGDGWMIRASLANASELDTLMDAAAYEKLVSELEAGKE